MTRYLSLAEYLWLAEQATGVAATTLTLTSRLELADSALHTPAAAFEGHEFYPDLLDKAAVLVCRLTRNHPLIDGNKRAAWASLLLFVELNGGRWDPDPPAANEAEAAMLAVAAGQMEEAAMTGWLRDRVLFG